MEEQDKEKSRLEALQREIYGRTFESSKPPLSQNFSEPPKNVERGWQHDTVPNESAPEEVGTSQLKKPFVKKIFIGVLIFFLLSAGVLAYMLFAGWNVISANNVEVSIVGPVSISAGNTLDLDVSITNQNSSAIENAVLYIDYPDGTKQAQDITQDLLHDKQTIGEIVPRGTTKNALHAVLFGELNAKRTIKVTLEYGLKNSNASYKKNTTYDVTISSTPLTISVSHQKEAISNAMVDFNATITSNSAVPLNNILVKVDYPFGFSFSSAEPQPTYENSYWLIPQLKPGEQKNITLHGQLQGEQGDERVFHFSIGTQDPQNNKVIATRYLTQPESIIVQKPPLAVSVSLNGSTSPQYTTVQGSNINGSVEITNNLSVRILDPKVQIFFGGQLYDPNAIQKGFGFFESSSNSLIWDKTNTNGLEALDPGQKMSFPFNFSTIQPGQSVLKNGTMLLRTIVTGKQVGQSGDTESLTSSDSKTIKTQTAIGLLARIVHSTGTFTNRGPIPPRVNTKTTYTVILTATNSSNDVRGGEVHATLPNYVHWLSASNPPSETVTWNPDKNEVIWRVGDIAASTGYSKASREVSFQVELVPSLSQVGSAPDVVTDISMSAIDSFTGSQLTTNAPNLSTRLPSDPAYNGQESLVTK